MATNNTPQYSFLCPYCLEKVEHDKVHFLACSNTGDQRAKTEAELQAENASPEERRRNGLLGLFRPRTEDEQLENFWGHRGGRAAYDRYVYGRLHGEIRWSNPLVTPENAKQMTRSGYERDADGFVTAIHDSYAARPEDAFSTIRLCPHCHNPLPPEYGRYPIRYIAVVGVTTSGKTVYLAQLTNYMARDVLGTVGLSAAAQEVENVTRIAADLPLPPATTKETMRRPMYWTINARGHRETLVFYDIAGENCVDAGRMQYYGLYIKHADGIVLLLDPEQFPAIAGYIGNSAGAAAYDPKTVLEALYREMDVGASRKCGIPLALTISKSDCLEQVGDARLVPPQNHFAQPIHHLLAGSSGFAEQDYTPLSGEVQFILTREAPQMYTAAKAEFEQIGCFAVSALGCGIRWLLSPTDSPLARPLPLTDDAAAMLRDLLKKQTPQDEMPPEMAGGIDLLWDKAGESLDEAGPESPADGSHVRLHAENGEITARSAAGRTIHYIFASMPKMQPQPRRIEEPLQWLLWQMGLIGKGENYQQNGKGGKDSPRRMLGGLFKR